MQKGQKSPALTSLRSYSLNVCRVISGGAVKPIMLYIYMYKQFTPEWFARALYRTKMYCKFNILAFFLVIKGQIHSFTNIDLDSIQVFFLNLNIILGAIILFWDIVYLMRSSESLPINIHIDYVVYNNNKNVCFTLISR